MDNARVDRGVKQPYFLYSVGENISWCNHFGRLADLPKVNIFTPSDPEIPFLSVYPREYACIQSPTDIYKNIHISTIHNSKKTEEYSNVQS